MRVCSGMIADEQKNAFRVGLHIVMQMRPSLEVCGSRSSMRNLVQSMGRGQSS